jgi:hypothetical protein
VPQELWCVKHTATQHAVTSTEQGQYTTATRLCTAEQLFENWVYA